MMICIVLEVAVELYFPIISEAFHIVSNPLLIAYNNTANSAGRTLSSLLKVIDKFAIGKEKETDELASFIAGKK